MLRFGKSAGPLLTHKQSFFTDNAEFLAEGHRIARVYTNQPRRTTCKCCRATLGAVSFSKHGIDYHICGKCGHLNGAHEDTDAFCGEIYTENSGQKYARNYGAADREAYDRRVRDIYLPKAEFLRDALLAENISPDNLSYADFGAGSGYFVAAMRALNWKNVTGYEVSEAQIALADAMMEPDSVRRHDMADIVNLAHTADCDVLSMIGVLEHLQNPREVLAAMRDNPRIRHFYMSVPLFSPCVFFEMIFPEIFHRQLSAGHTHLFTESSLNWLFDEFGMKRRSEWWFGTDMGWLPSMSRWKTEAAPQA